MIERLPSKSLIAANLLAVSALSACTLEIDRYHTDVSNVQCDDGQTKAELDDPAIIGFVVHGDDQFKSDTILVRRLNDKVSLRVEEWGDNQQGVRKDGYTKPVKVVGEVAISTEAAGVEWLIKVDDTSAVISGSC